MTITRVFGQLVRRERMALGLSQEALAERAELHRNAIGLIERAERCPSLESVFAIARGLNIPVTELVAKVEKSLLE